MPSKYHTFKRYLQSFTVIFTALHGMQRLSVRVSNACIVTKR